MNFSEIIKELRISRGFTQQEVADAIGVTKVTISSYERGIREPNFETLEALCDFFNVDTDYILGKEKRSTYYLDPAAAVIAEEVHKRPELKILFDASRKVSADDLQLVVDMISRLAKIDGF